MKAEHVIKAMDMYCKNSEQEVTGGEVPCYVETDDGTRIELTEILLTDVQTVTGAKSGLVFKGRR